MEITPEMFKMILDKIDSLEKNMSDKISASEKNTCEKIQALAELFDHKIQSVEKTAEETAYTLAMHEGWLKRHDKEIGALEMQDAFKAKKIIGEVIKYAGLFFLAFCFYRIFPTIWEAIK